MAGAIGRNLLIKKGGTTLLGIRTKSIAFAGEAIDITNDDDSGFRRLLTDVGSKSIDMSFDGVAEDELIQDIALGGGALMLTDVTITWPLRTGDTTSASISGDFFLSSFEQSGTYNDAVTFSASLQSSGEWTYTAAA
jgi:predicted secreted protein